MTQNPKGQRPKAKPKLSDQEQSEQFKKTAEELGAVSRSEFEDFWT